jgi:hypothetical protein
MPKGTSGLWHRAALLLKPKQLREHSCPLTGIIRSLSLYIAAHGRKIEQEGSLPPRWIWMEESCECGSKWSEVLQRVLFFRVEEEVPRFKICKSLSDLHHFQLSRGVDVYLVGEMVVHKIPVASGYYLHARKILLNRKQDTNKLAEN